MRLDAKIRLDTKMHLDAKMRLESLRRNFVEPLKIFLKLKCDSSFKVLILHSIPVPFSFCSLCSLFKNP